MTELISKRIIDDNFLKKVLLEEKFAVIAKIGRLEYLANIAARMLLKPAQFERFVLY